ncbi:MAG: hypothetical protein VXW84_13950, partial [Verrucomicrobiota bacterium]|nr:hypothetical protein [Verrucomicrobiota bacterium]
KKIFYHNVLLAVTFKVSDRESQMLNSEATRRNTTQSAILREGLRKLCKESSTHSLADRARDLIGGSVGPEDLSTSPRYLDGYGNNHSD